MRVTKILAIMAHPDDAEFTCGGTFAKWIGEGNEVHYIVCTSGDKGTKDPEITPHHLAEIREKEQRAAAQLLGVESVTFLRHKDGELKVDMAFRAEIAMLIRRHQPDIIFTHDAWRLYQLHPDHRAVGLTVTDAIVAARDHLYMPGLVTIGLEAHTPREIYLWGSGEPDYYEDITETIDLKLKALSRHRSQLAGFPQWRKRIRDWAQATGKEKGLKFAEAFKRITL